MWYIVMVKKVREQVRGNVQFTIYNVQLKINDND